MNIAVVGGGTRCKRLLDIFERHKFEEIDPVVVAIADLKPDAPGIVKARENGLPVTNDYNDFFKRSDIDLIIELTGDINIYNDIITKKDKNVRAIAHTTVNLFWEIYRLSALQKKTDQELHEATAMYNAVINELVQEDVLIIAHDYRILDVNDCLLKRLGLKREEVIGKHCYEITHRQNIPCSGEEHPCPLIQTLETEKPSQTTHVHLDKNNHEIYYSISTYPLRENDDIVGAIEVSRDITKDINAQKSMMQQEKLASIGRLSAGVAHEINNPLTTILTTAMLIQEDMDPDDENFSELETITKEALRCRKIVTSLLDFARQLESTKRENNINEIITESVFLTKKQAAFKDIELTQKLNDDILTVFVDKGQIEQVFINLILNSIEATESGGKITVSSGYNQRTKNVEVLINDNGEGIPKEDLNRIFDPFFTTKEEGTGLGLAITHGIIEQHNGTIDVDSKKGKGTTFKIMLPARVSNGATNAAK